MEMEPLQLRFVRQLLASGRDGEGDSLNHTRVSVFGPDLHQGLRLWSRVCLWGQCTDTSSSTKPASPKGNGSFLAGSFLMPQKVFPPIGQVLPSAFKMSQPVPSVQDLKGDTELG